MQLSVRSCPSLLGGTHPLRACSVMDSLIRVWPRWLSVERDQNNCKESKATVQREKDRQTDRQTHTHTHTEREGEREKQSITRMGGKARCDHRPLGESKLPCCFSAFADQNSPNLVCSCRNDRCLQRRFSIADRPIGAYLTAFRGYWRPIKSRSCPKSRWNMLALLSFTIAGSNRLRNGLWSMRYLLPPPDNRAAIQNVTIIDP